MKEDYVSFKTAKLLKEKGFKPPHDYRKWLPNMYTDNGEIKWGVWSDDWYPRITLQMAMKWLREVHYYYIQVMLDSWACGGHSGYYVVIQKTDSDFEMMLGDALDEVFYDTPEKAAEDAIMYIVENLI